MSKEEPLTFGALLRQLRLAAGLTQEELAERAQLSERAIRRLGHDHDRIPRLQSVRRLAEALDLAPGEQARLLATARPVSSVGDTLTRASALPRSFTPLVGRAEDIAVVKLLLEERRLVTVTGTGGVGKTRLALAVAAQMADTFDHVVFVELAPLGDPDDLLIAVAELLFLRGEGARALRDAVTGALSAGRTLLLLDNMEHLLAARDMILTLLAACPNLHVLITSREALHVRGERIYHLGPLLLPQRDADIPRSPAVRLFLDRARDAGAEVAIDQPTAEAMAELCRRLDGLPLAIELAAAWTPLLSPPALLARLTAPLPYLERGPQDVPARQRTMRNTIAWSYDLLKPEQQALFARLSVFAGGWTVHAVEALGEPHGDLNLLEGLSSLVERSLVGQQGVHEPRFFMLETIREYAAEKLSERHEGHAIRSAHAAYFLDMAENAERQYYGTRSAEFLTILETEHDNLRAALRWTLGGGDPQQGVRLAGALYRFWEVHGHLAEGRRWLASILDREDELGPQAKVLPTREPGKAYLAISGATSPWGRVLTGAAVMAGWQGDYAEATLRCNQRLDLSRDLGDVAGTAAALNDLGEIAAQQGDVALAAAYYEQCAEIDRQLDDTASTASTLGNLGWALRRLGDDERAVALLEEARALFREVGDTPHLPPVLCELGAAFAERGDMDRAMNLYRECGMLLRDMGDRTELPAWLEGLAALAVDQGQTERAVRLWGAAAMLRDSVGSSLPIAERSERECLMGRIHAESREDEWRHAWEAGQAMSLEEAIAYALDALRGEATEDPTPRRAAALKYR